MPGSYYDLDDFLAEEEVVQCQTKFDFSHLAHLDPDAMFNGMNQNNIHHIIIIIMYYPKDRKLQYHYGPYGNGRI